MTKLDTAIILAGGLGTRLNSVIKDIPKPMAPVAGKPFLEHLLRYWQKQGIKYFILSVGYKHEIIIDYFGYDFQGSKITYEIETTPLGTGGAFLESLKHLTSQQLCLLLNGDSFFEISLPQLLQQHQQANADWSMALFAFKEYGRYTPVLTDETGLVLSLEDHTKQVKLANGGVAIFLPEIFVDLVITQPLPFLLEPILLPALLKHDKRIYGFWMDNDFIDIGIPSDYFATEKFISSISRMRK